MNNLCVGGNFDDIFVEGSLTIPKQNGEMDMWFPSIKDMESVYFPKVFGTCAWESWLHGWQFEGDQFKMLPAMDGPRLLLDLGGPRQEF